MTRSPSQASQAAVRGPLLWAALFAMALTSFSLVSSEFLPGGLLTAMADDLDISAGQAGQTITVTAFIGFLVAPVVGVLTPGLDRRTLLVGLAGLAAVSNIAVALAPSLGLLLLARMLLGAALSGFWAMSLTVSARIVGADHVPRAMVFVNSGTTLATVIGVPLGVYMSTLTSWRVIFAVGAVLLAVTAVALRLLLPPVPAERGVSPAMLLDTMTRPGVRMALGGHVLTVLGHMSAYAFIRVALERMPDSARLVPALLLVFGIGGFVGNLGIGMLAERHLDVLRFAVPGLIAGSVLVVALLPSVAPVMFVAVALWGAGFGGWLIVVNAWAGRHLADRLEASGGLIVAGFQLAIMLGAGVGGVLVDTIGITRMLLIASTVALAGMFLFGLARADSSATPPVVNANATGVEEARLEPLAPALACAGGASRPGPSCG